jgi:hypothetical protein
VQHVGSCTDLAVLDVAEGDQQGGLAALDALCEGDAAAACARAAMIRLGDTPQPSVAGKLTPLDRRRVQVWLEDGAWRCYLERLERSDVSGSMSLFAAVDPTGRVEGAAGVGPFVDAPMQECLNENARLVDDTVTPSGGAVLARFDLFLDHHARVSFQPDNASALVPDELTVADELAELGPEFERCALLDPSEAAPIAVDVRIQRSGRIDVLGIPRSSEVAAVDTCMTEVLDAARVESTRFKVDGLVFVAFLQAALRSDDAEDR